MFLSVLRDTPDNNLEYNVKGFAAFSDSFIEKNKSTCSCCGFKSSRYMRIVSRNQIYSVFDDDNFFVACPFCFVVHRLEQATGKGLIIYLPEFTQSQLNMMVHTLWHYSRPKSINSTQFHYAQDLMNYLSKRAYVVDSALSDDAHLPGNMAFALKALSADLYEKRLGFVQDLRFFPFKESYEMEYEHWSSETYEKLMGPKPEQWTALGNALKRMMPDVSVG